ncbi:MULTISPECIES: SWIM zinc finger family protein [Salinibaculum]|uniref:SWIM zinc finger family protein n=1 Tax=Salinibaculum TaxID=2732368 RepID=UPI0030D38B91
MSIESSKVAEWGQSDALDKRLTDPEVLTFPEDWTLSESWQRAQTEADTGGPINDAERMVWLDESDKPKRVLFALQDDRLHAECSCAAWKYRGFCAHVAKCWWRWIRGRLVVHHLDTGRDYQTPPAWLQFNHDRDTDTSGLTAAELDAYLTCELANVGVRDYARNTDRAPGTVGNLLARARDKVGGQR